MPLDFFLVLWVILNEHKVVQKIQTKIFLLKNIHYQIFIINH
jgi:hypothetical protein